jgi:hypothetical protein
VGEAIAGRSGDRQSMSFMEERKLRNVACTISSDLQASLMIYILANAVVGPNSLRETNSSFVKS